MTGPLAGIRVVEFGNLVAAPYCGMLLADLGAAVTKVEPLSGDLARTIGPYRGGESVFFMAVNRGKRSLAIDLKAEQARRWVVQLCRQSDVLVHNLRGGAMERNGFGYEQLAAPNPRLVYAAISAFGPDGPDADRPGIDLIFQGESGMMSIAGGPGDPPQKTVTTIGDFVAGTNAALAISASLVERAKSGRGNRLDISLRDGLIAMQAGWNALFFATGQQPERTGTASPVTGPNQTFATADGYLNIAIVSDRHFTELCGALELFHLAGDRRFRDNQGRVANRSELAKLLEEILAARPTAYWLERLQSRGIPAGKILTLPEVFSDPQALHNQMLVEYQHPRAGLVQTQGSPIRIGDSPALQRSPPPILGADSAQVLAELGASDQEVDRLAAAGSLLIG